MKNKIYISGMHSGQNPCSGLGIARSIRKAFPNLTLVGVDHWQGSSGLHDSAIDEELLLPQWKQIDSDKHVDFLRGLLDSGHLWISALDMEVHWISENLGPHRNLLAPGGRALELSKKPEVRALEGMEFQVPEFIRADRPDSEVHSFLRHHSWQCWMKSPYHDAKRVTSWASFERLRLSMSKAWNTSKLFIQKHVVGNEETIAFTSFCGELLAAVQLQKRQITPEGKTWAGQVTPVEPEIFEQLKEVLRRLEWSGGGEIEYVRDPDGRKWIIECNPRFPAWIFGGTLSGINLPARLISRAWDIPYIDAVSRYPFFTRVVQEVAAKEEIGIPLPPDSTAMVWSADGKKGKTESANTGFLPDLKDQEEEGDKEEEATKKDLPTRNGEEEIPFAYISEVRRIVRSFGGETPARVHLDEWTRERFANLAAAISRSKPGSPFVRVGYSVKTSPTDDHLAQAKKHGFLAECISQLEVRRALDFGFRPDEIILNGPGKFWPLTSDPITGLHAVFCDSVEEFDRALKIPRIAECLGFRVRLPKLESRFGSPLEDPEQFKKILASVRRLGDLTLGFHFHMPSWAIGIQRWTESLLSFLIWCQAVERLTDVPIKRIDLGGGFFPSDLERVNFSAIQDLVGSALPHIEAVYLEPGRSLTQDGEILITRVLDIRHETSGKIREVVVDGCIAELPLAQTYSHRTFYFSRTEPLLDGNFIPLTQGKARILGRICMEDDVLNGGLNLPQSVEIGDFIIIGDAGGYERSMSYEFGRG